MATRIVFQLRRGGQFIGPRRDYLANEISSICLSGASTTSPISVSGATSTQVTRAGVMVSVPVPDKDWGTTRSSSLRPEPDLVGEACAPFRLSVFAPKKGNPASFLTA